MTLHGETAGGVLQMPTKPRPVDRWTLLILSPLAVWLLWAAGHYTVFDDEAFSCLRYTMPLGEMVRGLWHGVEPDPPLYYVLQNAWVRVFGVGPLGLRGLSIVLFLAGLVVMRRAATAWFDERVGLLTFILCAIHPAQLFFGFAARWYSCMFLAVAVLLWATARLSRDIMWHRRPAGANTGETPVPRMNSGQKLVPYAWVFAAAAVCYTNYFGTIVVGLVWLVGASRAEDKRPWGWAAIGVIVLYAPWLPAFWQQATTFPQVGGGLSAYAATAARTTMALLTGDLAGPRAWWVWAPMAVVVIATLVLLVRGWLDVWPIAVIVIGCFLVGVASRTMIDKYVMTFSGPACLLVAALLTRRCGTAALGCDLPLVRESLLAPTPAGIPSRESPPATASTRPFRCLRITAATSLSLAWLGCGVNLVTERHWSSMRWLDPWEDVIRHTLAIVRFPWPEAWDVRHPSARYYLGMKLDRPGRESFESWNRYLEQSASYAQGFPYIWPRPSEIVIIDASRFAHEAQAAGRDQQREKEYELVEDANYSEDPDADLKDRLDPTYKHPRHRITVRLWRLKDGTPGTSAPLGPTTAPMNTE